MKNLLTPRLLSLFFLIFPLVTLHGQEEEERDNPSERFRWFYEQRAYPYDTLKHGYLLSAYRQDKDFKKTRTLSQMSQTSSLSWTPIGPAPGDLYGGRVPAIAVHPSDGNTIYIGAADGGVWKTTNGGTSWIPLTDDQPSLASGSVAIDPINPNVIYWGTGEPYSSTDSYGGVGIFKSVDGGTTWSIIGLTNEKRITKIAINPVNPDIILVSTYGGVYRSSDGGSSWTKTSTFSSAWDVAIDPSDPSICYAGASGVYKSTDGGITWAKLSNGIPTSTSNLALALAPSMPSTVYVLISNTTFYKSTNAGSSWASSPIPSDLFLGQGWYDIAIAVSPSDPNRVIIGGVGAYYSSNGGNSWIAIHSGQGPDCHSITFGPGGIVYLGTDAGVNRSTDGGATFTIINHNLAITQFYTVGIDQKTPTYIWGGTQDNGTQKYTGSPTWSIKIGGDGGIVNVDYTNSNTVYAELNNGKHYRTLTGSGFYPIQSGIAEGGAWITPVVMNPAQPAILYTATSKIYKTTNMGDLWASTSGSYPWGGSLIRQLAIPKTSPQTIYSSPGSSLYKSTDDGVTWINVTTGLPGRTITSIVPHSSIPSLVYVTVSGSGTGHIFKSTDAGASWTSVNGNYPTDLPVNSVAIDPSNNSNLFMGTDLGIWSTSDGGASWLKDPGFPNTAVLMLGVTSDNYLVAATHGRSMFKAALQVGPFITVVSPNGNENWATNTSHNITWSQNGIANVKIEYSTNNGGAWSTVVASAAALDESYSWTLPNTLTTQAVVRISDASNAATNDVSNATFTIAAPPSVTVTSPDSGESWNALSLHTITWTSVSIASVKIEYSTNNGSSWNTIIASTAAAAGSYSWTVPNTPTTQALVRISDVSNTTTNDASNAVFSIVAVPAVAVTAPNGGQSWTAGTTQNIAWTYVSVTNVTIEYSSNNGSSWNTIIASTAASAGSYLWTVPNTPTTQALVRISDASNAATNDLSNAVFSIVAVSAVTVIAPNGGEAWDVLSVHNITWSQNGITNVKIEYSTNNGGAWNTVAASTAASAGSYSWTVPNTPTTQALVRISDASNAATIDLSNTVFSIVSVPTVPAVTVTAPNSGETWTAGTSKNITWTSVNITNVNIEYSTDNGSTWSTVVASTAASTGSYTWTVPNTPTTHARVRISDASNSLTNDMSDAAFSITAPTGVTVIAPNGGEIWNVATTHTITWVASGINNVKLKYSTNNGSTWTTIVSNISASKGSYIWSVPNTPTSQARVMVGNAPGTISDMSNAPFTISAGAAITVLSPNGGETWPIGTTQTINWSSAGVTAVKIEYSVDAGSSWALIASSTPDATKSYAWIVPNNATTQALVRMSDASNPGTNDVSNGQFVIAPPASIALASPNGGEIWVANKPYKIAWQSTSIDNVRLEYSTDNGANWSLIEANVSAAQVNHPWIVPDVSTDQALLRVSDESDIATSDQSDATFKITRVQFISSLLCSDNGSEHDTLLFGAASGATNGIDTSFGEAPLPPKPSPGTFDVRWDIPTTPGIKVDIRDTLSPDDTESVYTCQFQPGPGGYPMTLYWGTLGRGVWRLRDAATHGGVFNMRIHTNSSYAITDPTIAAVEIIHERGKSRTTRVTESWNLLSVPLGVSDNQVRSLFPSVISSAFSYAGGYLPQDALTEGHGYWLKFPLPDSSEILGEEIQAETLNIAAGWNMIGSISNPVATNNLQTIPSGIFVSNLFGYAGSYVMSDTILPGQGYWIESSQEGSVIVSSTALLSNKDASKLAYYDQDADMKLKFENAQGAVQLLYLIPVAEGIVQSPPPRCELPPLPPSDVFDVRFASQRFVEYYFPKKDINNQYVVALQSSFYPIHVSLVTAKDKMIDATLIDQGTEQVLGKFSPTNREILINDTHVTALSIIIEHAHNVPTNYVLEQSYPNPFNPTTSIQYAIPNNQYVTLKIYNLLGEVVATLVNDQKPAGSYKVEWNASHYPSGMYFYRLQAGNFLMTRKMLLAK